jgi:hypothetical protein
MYLSLLRCRPSLVPNLQRARARTYSEAGAARPKNCCVRPVCLRATGMSYLTTPGIDAVNTCPARIGPTPSGVPVRITSPRSSVIADEMYSINSSMLQVRHHPQSVSTAERERERESESLIDITQRCAYPLIISAELPCCLTSPSI